MMVKNIISFLLNAIEKRQAERKMLASISAEKITAAVLSEYNKSGLPYIVYHHDCAKVVRKVYAYMRKVSGLFVCRCGNHIAFSTCPNQLSLENKTKFVLNLILNAIDEKEKEGKNA